jgi:hypothetical protein
MKFICSNCFSGIFVKIGDFYSYYFDFGGDLILTLDPKSEDII